MTIRRVAVLVLALLCGCGEPCASVENPSPITEPALDTPAESAFRLDKAKQVLYLDTRVAPPQKRRFDIGQGSITLETLRVKNGKLTFRYTPEVEGGYVTYECSVAVSPKPVEFKIDPSGVPGATSIELSGCKVVGKGSLLDQ